MNSALYRGWVRHRRLRPSAHQFRYGLFQLYLDLSELDRVFRGRLLWSSDGPNLAWFRREDHWGDPAVPLEEAVRNLVRSRTGTRPTGPIRLLTHLRYFGYVINPVSFYYCFDADGHRVQTIVAEVNNTPWGERHCYVLTPEDRGTSHDFVFAKEFHVSPFMPMEQTYRWRFSQPGETLVVHMDSRERHGKVFDATLVMKREPLDRGVLAGALLRYPFMTAKVVAAIYCQALQLRLKRTPFYPHPKHSKRMTEVSAS